MIKIIRFHANWCAPCKNGIPVWEEVKSKLEGVLAFEDSDIDSDLETRAIYAVKSIPTYIAIDENGTEVARKVGTCSTDSFLKWINGI